MSVYFFPIVAQVVSGACQRMEQVQGTDLEGDTRQDMGQDLQVPRFYQRLADTYRYTLPETDIARTEAHLLPERQNHAKDGGDGKVILDW